MTVSELYHSVAQLGFEESLEDNDRFFYAANRALLQVNSIRPVTSAYVINHKTMENRVREESFTPIEKTDDLFFEASDVKAYYFEADGNGTAYIDAYDEYASRWEPINTITLKAGAGFSAHYGFIKKDGKFINGRVRIHFAGEYLYSVRNVAMYAYVYSDSEDDIPAFSLYTRYDISELTDDFLSLASPPIQEEHERRYLNQGYDVENGRVILLPYGADGIYRVVYNRKPNVIKNEGEITEDVIDLDEELCSLLPVLIASYIWMDDEPEKAEYYLVLYRERAADIERRIRSAKPVTIKSINGW